MAQGKPKFTAILMGHSFLSGLHDHLMFRYKLKSNGTLSFPSFCSHELKVDSIINDLHIVGHSGAKVTVDFQLPTKELTNFQPQIAILDIGSNDIMSHAPLPDIEYQIISTAEALVNLYNVQQVKVCSVLRRQPPANSLITYDQFCTRAYNLNGQLSHSLAGNPRISYHIHEGFWTDANSNTTTPTQWSFDGIHPNHPEGRAKYKKSLTAAIRNAARDVPR